MAGWADEVIDFIPGLSSLRASDLPENILTDLHSDMSVLFYEVGNRITTATAVVLINTFQGLDVTIDAAVASKIKSTLGIGPLNLLSPLPLLQPRDERCLSWLDGQDDATVAYVGFGTIPAVMIQTQIAEIARGIVSCGMRFLWSLPDDGLLPPGFLE